MQIFALKKYDEPLICFHTEKTIYDETIIEIHWITSKKEELPERFDGTIESLKAWLKNRMIPRNRAFVKEILVSQGLNEHDLEETLKICMALSVNDVYWVTPEEFHGKFDDFNLYDHSFSDALALVAFTGYSNTIKELRPSPEMTTNGMLPKAWRRIEHELFLYKGGTNAELYSNGGKEPYSEYYAAQIACIMGIKHVGYDLERWKGILASVCKNFTSKEQSYVPIGNVLESYSISKLVEKLTELNFMDDFKDMILFDAVINNEDRHYGNFGFLKNNHTNEFVEFAPLFDHGISLFAYLNDKDIKQKKVFDEYRKAHNQSAIGAAHEKLVHWFCTKEDVVKLKALYHFRFTKHEKYNLPDDRLEILEQYVRDRAVYLSKIL